MGSRTWIKIYCDRWLNGTIREETPEIRGIWVDLLVLAGSGKYGDSGEIKITDHVGFLDEQLADLLQISRQKWATIKEKLIKTDRVIVKNNNIIAIKKWSKYQSEYDRQKIYRQLEDTNNSTPKNSNLKLQTEVTPESTARERDKRIEKENIEREESVSLSKEDVFETYKKDITGSPEQPREISEEMENELDLAVKRFTAPWVRDAIREGVKRKRKDWRYIAGILKNWERYGKDQPEKTRDSKKPIDPDKYIKGRYGHLVNR